MFLYLYTLVYFDYIKTVQKNKFVDYDMKTITAGDYTIEFDIARETYEHWKNHYFDKTNFMTEAAQFRQFIWKELETLCSALPNQGYEPDEEDVKIAQITMAYNNSKIIKMLKQRGDLIKKGNWDKLAKKNAEILEHIQNEDNLNQLQIPVSIFATFNSEEGIQRAKFFTSLPVDAKGRKICG